MLMLCLYLIIDLDDVNCDNCDINNDEHDNNDFHNDEIFVLIALKDKYEHCKVCQER